MQSSETHPVIIIGAGPTGLTAANLLARYGVASIILEKNAAPMDIPRAIVLDDEGARVLQVFGADKTYLPQTITGLGGKYYDDTGRCFAEVGTGPPNFGFGKKLYINQPDLEADLQAHIANNPLIDMRFGHEVVSMSDTGEHVSLSVSDAAGAAQELRATYILACDGGRSPTRDRLGIALSGSTYSQDWIVIDTKNDPDQVHFSKFFCNSQRPHVSIPAPNGGRRYEFMLLPGETPEQILADGFIEDLLTSFRDLAPADLIRKTLYTFHARIAESFRAGRVMLLGDAAHLTPPFAGQGMNAGLRDAANVAWKLAAVLNAGASDAILDSYDVERRDPAWAMIQLAVAMGDIVMPIDPARLAFREHLVAALKPFPAVQDYFLQMKFKPKPRYSAGLFCDLDTQPFEASLVGEMIPQPDVVGLDGGVKLDVALGAGFALIAQNDGGEAALRAVKDATFCGLPLACLRLDWGDARIAPNEVSRYDVSGAPLARPLRTHRDQIMLIRPDRYCAAAFFPGELAEGLSDYAALMQAGE